MGFLWRPRGTDASRRRGESCDRRAGTPETYCCREPSSSVPNRTSPLLAMASSFSGHETFPLRFLWLPKVVREAEADPGVFQKDEAIALFGVGKNMVRSMKHWGLATGVLQPVEGSRGEVEPTVFGEETFGAGGVDPYCERLDTAWQLHWNLCRDPNRATLWHFLFGHWRGGGVDLPALEHELAAWLDARGEDVPSASTLKRDLLCLAACYAPPRSATSDPEDAATCPLTALGLAHRSAGTLYFRGGRRAGLTARVFAAAVLDFWDEVAPGRQTLSIDEAIKHAGSPGRVFLLSEDQAFELVEAVGALDGAPFRFDDTAGVQQLYRSTDSIEDADAFASPMAA